MDDSTSMSPAQIAAIRSHLDHVRPRCPLCGGQWPDTWTLHGKFVALPEFDAALRPIAASVPAVLLKCRRCRFMAPFRAAGPDDPLDLSGPAAAV